MMLPPAAVGRRDVTGSQVRRFPQMINAGLLPSMPKDVVATMFCEEKEPAVEAASAEGWAEHDQPFRLGTHRPRLLERKEHLREAGGPVLKAQDIVGSRHKPRSIKTPVQSEQAPSPPQSPSALSEPKKQTKRMLQSNAGFPLPYNTSGPSAKEILAAQGLLDEFDHDAGDSRKAMELTVGKTKSAAADILRKINLATNKRQRMKNVTLARKVTENLEDSKNNRDRITRRQDVELAQESFGRFFKKGNAYELGRMLEALADFGIRAVGAADKAALNEVLLPLEEKGVVAFSDFCAVVEEARQRLRQLHSITSFQAWKHLDTSDDGALSASQVMQLLENMSLISIYSPDRDTVEAFINECPRDEEGLIRFDEAEFAIEFAKQLKYSAARRKERTIQQEYGLSAATFQEFRSQLLVLYVNFMNLDGDENGRLDAQESEELLSEFGFDKAPDDPASSLQLQILAEVRRTAEECGGISFSGFLGIVRELREFDMASREAQVSAVFKLYDPGTGLIDVRDVCTVLSRLCLQPTTVLEQENIAQVFQEVDVEGNNMFSLDAVLVTVQCINERLVQSHRQVENKHAEQLGMSRKKTTEFRRVFQAFDESRSGTLALAGVGKALAFLDWLLPMPLLEKLFDEVDEDQSGCLRFLDFLKLMVKVEEEISSQRAIQEIKKKQAAAAAVMASAQGDSVGPAISTHPSSTPTPDFDNPHGGHRRSRRPGQPVLRMASGNTKVPSR